MANEHIKTAASNLQRAAQDVRQQINEIHNQVTHARQQALSSIKNLKTQIDQLQRSKNDSHTDMPSKVAIEVQVKNLQLQIAQIEKDTNDYARKMEGQANGLGGEISEFENLSSHLNAIAWQF